MPAHPAITRRPATDLKADSDLGQRLVTVGVGPLSPSDRTAALKRGLVTAETARQQGFIHSAALFLQGYVVTTASPAFTKPFHFLTANTPEDPEGIAPRRIDAAGGDRLVPHSSSEHCLG